MTTEKPTAVLLCNLGTPDAPTTKALRRYLAQFLSDPRIIEIPRVLWLPLLHGIILRVRPRRSAAKYASVWGEAGSPLAFWTERQANLLSECLNNSGLSTAVLPAMRYGEPSAGAQLQALLDAGVQRVLVLPLYPQYSTATTASLFDGIADWVRRARRYPELRFINDYHDHPDYIAALASSVRMHWESKGRRAQHLVMSFHGMPESTVRSGDPYADQCRNTARLLADELQLVPEQYTLTFQSRFGPAQWLQPYTEPTLKALAKAGTRSVEVMCPGFASDCLETLEEINMEARQAFLLSGGQVFDYIPCLNDSSAWITTLTRIAEQHLAGWTDLALEKVP